MALASYSVPHSLHFNPVNVAAEWVAEWMAEWVGFVAA
jgi:hypothetical protein